jgi:hypothetical protein
MILTDHAAKRMNQRGVTKEMIDLTLRYGRRKGDRIILKSRDIRRRLHHVSSRLKSRLLKIADKGGLVVVLGDERSVVITVYAPHRYV